MTRSNPVAAVVALTWLLSASAFLCDTRTVSAQGTRAVEDGRPAADNEVTRLRKQAVVLEEELAKAKARLIERATDQDRLRARSELLERVEKGEIEIHPRAAAMLDEDATDQGWLRARSELLDRIEKGEIRIHPRAAANTQPAPPVKDASVGDKDTPFANRLPKPLEGVTCDLSAVEKHFKVIEATYYAPDEFRVGDPARTVAEETIVWTLEAKEALKGAEVYRLFHDPRPKVSFQGMVDGRKVRADARPEGYRLIGDLRWFRQRPPGPDLATGDQLKAWVHLGKEGSVGFTKENPDAPVP